MMKPAACLLGRPGHVEVDPCRRIGTGAIKSRYVTMRPEVMYAALRFIKILQIFLRYSHTGECNLEKMTLYYSLCFLLLRPVGLSLKANRLLRLGPGGPKPFILHNSIT